MKKWIGVVVVGAVVGMFLAAFAINKYMIEGIYLPGIGGGIVVVVGVVVGVFLAAFAMNKYMIEEIYLPGKSFAEIDARIKEVVPQFHGWGFPAKDLDMHKILASHGFGSNIKNLKKYFICNMKYADAMLKKSPYMSGIMPCSWALYETTDGKVYITKMNVGLMSKMHGGFIGATMKAVAKTEDVMLTRIITGKDELKQNIADKKKKEEVTASLAY